MLSSHLLCFKVFHTEPCSLHRLRYTVKHLPVSLPSLPRKSDKTGKFARLCWPVAMNREGLLTPSRVSRGQRKARFDAILSKEVKREGWCWND